MDTFESKNFLSVKILYLNDISLFSSLPIFQEPWDFLSNKLIHTCFANDSQIYCYPSFSFSENLHLPDSLPFNYLGESIYFFFKIQNDSTLLVADSLLVKIELRSPKYFAVLHEETISHVNFTCSIDRTLVHEINDLGTHTFIANIKYSHNGEILYLQRSFSFEVNKPIDIKTKYISPEFLDFIILESRIHNMTHQKLFVDELSLRSLNKFSVCPMKLCLNLSKESSLCEVQTKETSSYLFKISPPKNSFILSKDIGKLDICWRNSLIQRGRLQTGNLDQPNKSSQNLRVSIADIPNCLHCNHPFNIHLNITNISSNTLVLQLSFNNLPSNINWCGKSNIVLPEVIPQGSIPIVLKAVCFCPGSILIGGLTFTDLKMNREHRFDYLQNVLVV